MGYSKKILKGLSVILCMNILASLAAYITRVILARNLQPAEFGLFYAVFTFVTFFLFFRDFGLSKAGVKFIADFNAKEKYDELKTTIFSVGISQLIVSLIFGGLLLIFAKYLANNYFKNPLAEILITLLVIYVLFSMGFIFFKNILYGFQNFSIYALIGFIKNLLVLIILLTLLYFGFNGPIIPTLAYAIVAVVLFVGLLPFVKKVFHFSKYKLTNVKKTVKMLLLFAFPVMLTSVGSKIIGQIDTLILTSFRSLQEVGVYNVVLPSAIMLLFIGNSISGVVFPIVADLWAKNDFKRLIEGIRLIHKYTFVIVIPLIFTILAFAKEFIFLLFGENYVSGELSFQVLLVGVFFYSVAGINNNIITAVGKPKIVTYIVLGSALLNIVVNLLLIPSNGIVGAAIATTLSYFVVLIISTYYVTTLIGKPFPGILWLKIGVIGGGFGYAMIFIASLFHLISSFKLFLLIIGCLLIYVLLLNIFKIIDLKEIKRYLKLK